jgi:hypothetical protein
MKGVEMPQNWKTTTQGLLSAFALAVGPISGLLASLQAMQPKPNYTLAIFGAVLLCLAAIAKAWIGLLQNDALSTQQVGQIAIMSQQSGIAPTAAEAYAPGLPVDEKGRITQNPN